MHVPCLTSYSPLASMTSKLPRRPLSCAQTFLLSSRPEDATAYQAPSLGCPMDLSNSTFFKLNMSSPNLLPVKSSLSRMRSTPSGILPPRQKPGSCPNSSPLDAQGAPISLKLSLSRLVNLSSSPSLLRLYWSPCATTLLKSMSFLTWIIFKSPHSLWLVFLFSGSSPLPTK